MTRVLFDAFHHMMPGHRIGPNIAVGGYGDNCGRYTPGDCFHPNGLLFTQSELANTGYDLRLLHAPLSEPSLFDADILLLPNPDYPGYEGASPHRLVPEDVDAIMAFLHRGGGVMVLVNSFLSRPDYWEENFDLERVNLLFERLGVRWDPNFMSDINSLEKAKSGVHRIGYGQGGRVVGSLPLGFKPLITLEENIYGFEGEVGKGKLILLGDAGLFSNGLFCFPGFDNGAFVMEAMHKLRPTWSGQGAESWNYSGYSHLAGAPSKGGLNEEIFRGLRPQARWKEDYHYRNVSWEHDQGSALGKEVWERAPLRIDSLRGASSTKVICHWLRLDDEAHGPAFPVNASVRTTTSNDSTDIHILGRASSKDCTWKDLCQSFQGSKSVGEVDEVHGVFEMKIVLDEKGQPRSARWSQGQIIYARNSSATKYGYEIILRSRSGVISPTA